MSKGTTTASWLGEHASGIDLRRTIDDRTSTLIVNRSEWLADPERSMVRAVFENGLSAAEVARVLSMDPRIARRRVAKAAARLLDPRAVYVSVCSKDWPDARARVGRAIFHQGLTLRDTASRLGLSLYTIRVHRDAIEGMFEIEQNRHQRERSANSPDRRWR